MKRGLLIFLLLLMVPILAFSEWVKQESGTTRNLRSVWVFIGPVYTGTVVAVGDSGTILTSTDYGQTWISAPTPTNQTLYGVSQELLTNFLIHWGGAVGGDTSGIILRTTDDGMSWLTRATQPYGLYTISFGDSMNGMAAGKAGAIWGTTDGGVAWSQKSSFLLPVNWYGSWYDTYIAQIAWFCGQGGTIIETTNAGASWTVQTSGTTGTLRAISFTDAFYYGVVVGDSGRIFRTTNQGSTWLPVSSGVSEDLTGVICDRGGFYNYAVGVNGRILKSYGSGSTWTPETTGTTKNLHGINSLYDASGIHVWAVGDSGTILYKFIMSGVEDYSPPLPQAYSSRLMVFPNPFTSYATIPGHPSDRFVLYDISGRKVGTYKGDRIGEGLSAGVYFLRAERGDRNPLRVVKVR